MRLWPPLRVTTGERPIAPHGRAPGEGDFPPEPTGADLGGAPVPCRSCAEIQQFPETHESSGKLAVREVNSRRTVSPVLPGHQFGSLREDHLLVRHLAGVPGRDSQPLLRPCGLQARSRTLIRHPSYGLESSIPTRTQKRSAATRGLGRPCPSQRRDGSDRGRFVSTT
jgi:hypothetical protein